MKTINTFTKGNYVLSIIRYNEPTYGGHYSVELTYNDKIIKEKDGLCLDAAHEYFLLTANQLKN